MRVVYYVFLYSFFFSGVCTLLIEVDERSRVVCHREGHSGASVLFFFFFLCHLYFDL